MGNRKRERIEFTLYFDSYHFKKLVGLKKISDIHKIRENANRVFKNVMSGSITHDMIMASKDYPLMEVRLDYFHALEEFLDSNDLIFNYNNNINPSSEIPAVFLLQNDIDGKTNYLFVDKDMKTDYFYCRTFFPKENTDYSARQQRLHLLYKAKEITLDNGDKQKQLLFHKDGFDI